jgi:hypothetical protein
MAQENINLGAFPNDPQSDPVRIAFAKAQNNFTQLFSAAYTSGVTSIKNGAGITVDSYTGDVLLSAKIAKVTIQTDDNLLVGIGNPTGNSAVANDSNNVFKIGIASSINLASITAANIIGVIKTASQPNITSVGKLNSLTLNEFGTGLTTPIVTSTLVSATAVNAPLISATGGNTQVLFNNNSVVGASSNLTFNGTILNVIGNITSTNAILGNLASANYIAGTLTTNAQPNITSIGTLTSLFVTGNISSGNASLGNLATANYFSGNGYNLSNIRGANVTDEVTYARTANGVAGANVFGQVGGALVAGTVYTNEQPNITSVGTLTNLGVSGYVTATSVITTGDIRSSGNIYAKNFVSQGDVVFPGASIVNGQITALKIIGEGGGLSNITGANVSGFVDKATVASTVNIPSSATTGPFFLTMASGATGNLRLFTNSNFGFNADTGTLSSNSFVALKTLSAGTDLNVTANAYVGNLTSSGVISTLGNLLSGNIRTTGDLIVSGRTTTASIIASQSISSDFYISASQGFITGASVRTPSLTTGSVTAIGSITGNWQLTTGSRLTATFADLAEVYAADRYIEPGTVVDFDGHKEITETHRIMSCRVAGVVSTDPAYVLNSAMECEFPTMVALQGRVPCKVVGKVRKGDMMVSAGGGIARAEESPRMGSVIGKSLENFDGGSGVIEIAVGRF